MLQPPPASFSISQPAAPKPPGNRRALKSLALSADHPREARPVRGGASWHVHCLFLGDSMCTSFDRRRIVRDASPGFTLVEIAVTILILGLLLAISVPTIQSLSGSYSLRGNSEAIAGQIRLAREKAIATGTGQPFHFFYNTFNSDYHIHYPSGFVGAKWSLSKGITYYWGAGTLSGQTLTMTPDGRTDQSGWIILQDGRGVRDTVSVQMSGLVLVQ